MEATLYQFGEETKIVAGKNGVTSVFASNNNNEPNTLVVVYDDKIIRHVGIPFSVTSIRKEKDIEA